jgi:hypothetical protein
MPTYSRLLKVINNSDDRYLDPAEQSEILGYATSLPNRLDAMRQIEGIEAEVVRETIDQIRRRYPRFEMFHERGWEKGIRDAQLVLRQVVQSMLLDDSEVGEDKTYIWNRTILASFNFTPAIIRETYTLMKETIEGRISREAFDLLEPHMNHAIETISDIPEPASPAV